MVTTIILPIYTLTDHSHWRFVSNKYKGHLEYHSAECVFKNIYIELVFLKDNIAINQNTISILNTFEQSFIHPKSSRLWFSLQPFVHTDVDKRFILHLESIKPVFNFTLKEIS